MFTDKIFYRDIYLFDFISYNLKSDFIICLYVYCIFIYKCVLNCIEKY